MPTYLLRVPDHLGDAVMAMPAVAAIAKLGPISIQGPAWSTRLYGPTDPNPQDPDIAILFKPSFSAAWNVRGVPRRVGAPGSLRRWLLTDVVCLPKVHRREQYAALAAHIGATATGYPGFSPTLTEQQSAPAVSSSDVLLLPISRSQATVGWPQFRHLADALGSRAIFAAGPGECASLAAIAGNHRCIAPTSIGEFSALAQRVSAVVATDSGLSHLAAAARASADLDPTTVHVIFGSTDPCHTGAAGCTSHGLEPIPCQPCYRKRCTIKPMAPPCLDVDFSTVLGALQ
jgi:heptosyltransferase-2